MENTDPMIKRQSTPAASTLLMLWKVLAIVFIVTSIALLIALIVVATKKGRSDENQENGSRVDISMESCTEGMSSTDDSPKSAGVFDDLTVEEITAVRNYLLRQPELNLTKYVDASVDSNYIYSIQVLPPSKNEVLKFLDNDGPKPERRAIAVVFHGATDPPVVREYIVSPVANPTQHVVRKVPGGRKETVTFNARPFDSGVEYKVMYYMMAFAVVPKLQKLMNESYDEYILQCTNSKKCLYFQTAPLGFTAEDRYSLIYFIRYDFTGHYFYPIDLRILLDHGGANPLKWKILKVLHNNQTFDSVDELVAKYENNTIEKIKLPVPKGDNTLFSSYERRGAPQPCKPMRGPKQYQPDGQRYTVKGRHTRLSVARAFPPAPYKN